MVPVSGEASTWAALEQALEVARREEGRLLGLHVVPAEDQMDSPEVQTIQREFRRRCQAAGVPGNLVVQAGKVARTIADRAQWADLIALNLAHPPAPQPLARLSSGFRTLVHLSPVPVLAVPGTPSPLSRALLAYDGSPRAREALYVAAYLAGRWEIGLTVVSVLEHNRVTAATLDEAGAYLRDHGIEATLVEAAGPVADAILDTLDSQGCDLILVGGYGHSPVVEIVLGSAVDQLLCESCWPVLICR
jgi:nucleotide-binding universal stress UspA family protein